MPERQSHRLSFFKQRLAHCGLDAACLTKNRLASSARSSSRNGLLVFFPWPLCVHSSRHKKASAKGRPSLRCGPKGCGPIVSGLFDSHRDPMSNGGDLF